MYKTDVWPVPVGPRELQKGCTLGNIDSAIANIVRHSSGPNTTTRPGDRRDLVFQTVVHNKSETKKYFWFFSPLTSDPLRKVR